MVLMRNKSLLKVLWYIQIVDIQFSLGPIMGVMIRWLILYYILVVKLAGKIKVYYLNKILLYVSLERKGATLNGNVNVLAPLIFFHVTLLIFYKYEMALII